MRLAPVSPDRPERGTAADRRPPDHVRVRSFIFAISTTSRKLERSGQDSETSPHAIASPDGRWELSFVPEPPAPAFCPAVSREQSSLTLVLGDDAEWNDLGERGSMGHAAAVRLDCTQGNVQAWSSITGLPPIFLCRRPDRVILTSDLSLLRGATQPLEFDPAAVVDLFQVGYPTGHRSLFKGTVLVPGGHVVRMSADGRVTSAQTWSLPEVAPRLDWPSYIEFQMQVFRAAIGNMDLSGSFLSLTGGVDTRTILAVLVSEGRSLPA